MSVAATRPVPRGPLAAAVVEPLEGRTLFAVNPAGFTETPLVTGLTLPTAMAFAPDGRLFVSEQRGTLRIVKDGQLLPTPFATLPADNSGERGLLGVTFHPNFASNGFVYVYWTTDSPTTHNRVTRFTSSGDVAVAGSERTIFDLPDLSSATNHNGGGLHFGQDGKLYISVGENANASNAQSLSTTKGKVLRINADGSIPADNPFVSQTSGINQAIYALGFRNPYTFAVQPGTGRIFVNDVGQGAFEEVDDLVPGANYGWPSEEGPSNNPSFKAPVFSYDRRGSSSSEMTGGTFYNPPVANFPGSFTGDYFFADYGQGFIKVGDIAGGTPGATTNFATGLDHPADLRVGPDGALYALEYGGGRVQRFSFAASDAPSIATPPASRRVAAGQPATFSVTPAGAAPFTYQWQRDGQDIPGATGSSFTLASPSAADNGAAFRVVVSNSAGNITSTAATLTVVSGAAPTATIDAPAAGTLYRAGDTIPFSGTASDAEDGPLTASAFEWEVVFHHADHTHPFVPAFTGKTGDSFTIPTLGETAADVFYRLHLRVTDSTGLTTEVTRDVTPITANITLATNVPGLAVTLDGSPVSSPLISHGVAGIQRQLSAPSPQTFNGTVYDFASWSDGGGPTHDITTPDVDTTLTATYEPRIGAPTGADLTATIDSKLKEIVVGGERGRAVVRVTNAGTEAMSGAVGIRLFLSADATLDVGDVPVTELLKTLKLRPGKSKSIKTAFTLPLTGDGNYVLLAELDAANTIPEANESNNVIASAPTIYRAPFVDLSGTFVSTPTTATIGKRGTVTIGLLNGGNVTAAGQMTITLFSSTDSTGSAGPTTLGTLTTASAFKLKSGATKRLKVRFIPPADLAAGTYFFSAALDSGSQIAESDEANNFIVATDPFTLAT